MDLREAAGALGVHYQTAYGWVRQGVLPARKVGRGYAVSEAGAAALDGRRRLGARPARPIRVRDRAAQSQALYAAIASGEETLARHQVERLAAGVPLIDLCEQVVAPALRRIGEDWAAGHISIAQEHRASAICERLLAAHARQPAGRPHGTAVVATPPGERHSLPALMAAADRREPARLRNRTAREEPAMARYQATVRSHRPAAETFAYLATFSNAAEWDPGVLAGEQLDAGPVTVGTRFRLVVPFLGLRLPLTYHVTSYQPGREVVLAAASALLCASDRIVVTGGADGSVVSYQAEARLRGPLHLLDPILRPGFRAVADRAAAGLAQALSRDPSPDTTASPGTPVLSAGTAPQPRDAP